MRRAWRYAVCGLIAGVIAILIFPWLAPRALGFIRGDIVFRIPSERKTIYLTIDDAPTEGTPEILAVLKRHRVRATFFIISGRVRAPEQLDAILADGHALGHHMTSTRPGWQLSYADFVRDFDACAEVLRDRGAIRFFRPPSGYATKEQVAYARAQGLEAILGTAYPLDTRIHHVGGLVRLASWLSVSGGIIILHDGRETGARTAEVLDRLIPLLKARGFEFGELKQAALQPRRVNRGL